jgi:hypothetical protein
MTDAENIHQRMAALKAKRQEWTDHASDCARCAPGLLRDTAAEGCDAGQATVREIAAAYAALESVKAAALRGRCR